jgi:hypothetical protein
MKQLIRSMPQNATQWDFKGFSIILLKSYRRTDNFSRYTET